MIRKKLPTSDLKANTHLNSILWLDDDFILASQELPVRRELISSLKEWNYQHIYEENVTTSLRKIQGTLSTASSTTLNDNMEEERNRENAKIFFKEFCLYTQKVYEIFHTEGYTDLNSVTNQIKSVLSMLKSNRNFMLRLPDLVVNDIDDTYTHSSRSTIIALAIGETIKFPNFRLIELGISVLLHEMGMMKIPKSAYDKPSSPTEDERKLIATHPIHGVKMIQQFAKQYANPLSQEIILGIAHHHERIDGLGYPQRIKGNAISLFGKIIAVVCAYESLISKRHRRKAYEGCTAVLLMLKEAGRGFDEKIIAALVNSLSLYPLGSYVKLSNGNIGLVISFGKEAKCPIVKLQIDENMHQYKEFPVVQTKESGDLSISEGLNNDEVDRLIGKRLISIS